MAEDRSNIKSSTASNASTAPSDFPDDLIPILGSFPSLSPVPPERLRSYETLSDAEARAISQMLPDAEQYLAKLEAITRHLDDVQKIVKANKCLVSPIRRVPNEILRMIFTFCCKAENFRGFSERQARIRKKKSELLIYDTMTLDALSVSHVCSSWRQTMLSMPEVWTEISVWLEDDVDYPQQDLDRCHAIVRLYLERSRKQLLSIHMRFPLWTELEASREEDDFESSQYEWHRDIFRSLMMESKRWEQADISMCRFNINSVSQERSGCPGFPELRIAAIECLDEEYYSGYHGRDEFEELVFPFGHSSKLHTLFLKDTPFFYTGLDPRLPLLSRFEMQGVTGNPLPALEWAPKDCDVLVKDVPDNSADIPGLEDDDVMISCVAHSLTFEISSTPCFPSVIIDRLDLSNVHTLRFVATDEAPLERGFAFEDLDFEDLLARAEPPPEALELVHVPIPEGEMIDIIHNVLPPQGLKSLSVYERESSPFQERHPVLTRVVLGELEERNGYLPDLENLTLSFRFEFSKDLENVLLKVVESRCSSPQRVTALHSVVLRFRHDIQLSKRFRKRISSLEKHGVSISIHFDD